jgi:hypothetical protein
MFIKLTSVIEKVTIFQGKCHSKRNINGSDMKLTSVIDKVTTFQGNIHLLYIAEFQNLLFLCMTQGLNR